MSEEDERKFKTKYEDLRILLEVMSIVIGVIASVIGVKTWNMNKQVNQHEIENEELELQPAFDVEESGIVRLGDANYRRYKIENTKMKINGGTMKMHAAIVVICDGIVVKIVGIQGALYEEKSKIPFETENQTLTFYVRESDIIEKKRKKLESDIIEYLSINGKGKSYEFSVKISVISAFQFSNRNNDQDEEIYIFFIDDQMFYVNKGEYEYCDRYCFTFDGHDQGEEYDNLVINTGKRIMDCG